MEDTVAEKQRGSDEEDEKSSGFLRNCISNMASGEENGEEKEEKGQKESGFLKNFMSNMVSGDVAEEQTNGFMKNFMSNGASAEENGKEEQEKKKSGFLKNFISNMVYAEEGEEEEKEDGGIVRNVMVPQGESHDTGCSESVREYGGNGGGGGSGGDGRGGGIIDNIVSHLPASLQGDAVTTTDEATILIHSIIHE